MVDHVIKINANDDEGRIIKINKEGQSYTDKENNVKKENISSQKSTLN